MTKWPVLLVHGLFYREDYWGRVPGVLRQEGAVVLCPRHQSTARVAQSGGQLARLIRVAAGEGGKVNLIAHSKGGLDSRWAISREGAAPYVASLTTVNTPHRGCLFVDKLLEKLPRPLQRSIAAGYDAALEPVEGLAPDFFGAVEDLTAACAGFNREVPDAPGVFYQSAGSRLERAAGGRSPMGLSQLFIQGLDGPNDGLVAESSFPWGGLHPADVRGRPGGLPRGRHRPVEAGDTGGGCAGVLPGAGFGAGGAGTVIFDNRGDLHGQERHTPAILWP